MRLWHIQLLPRQQTPHGLATDCLVLPTDSRHRRWLQTRFFAQQAKPQVEFSDFVDDQDLEEQLRQALSYDV